MRAIGLTLFCAALAACGGGGGGDDSGDDDDDDAEVPTAFDAGVTRVVLEIDHETGNEPYTGAVIGFGDTFDLLVTNLERLFAGTRELTVPTTPAEMEDVGPIADEELTVADLLDLADQHRDLGDGGDTATYYVLFVSGYFADDDGPRTGVLGVSLGDTGVVAMFKDVIASTGVPAVPNLERFVEQATLVHELGHALGLVNNGVPLTSEHHDAEHGAHCDDDACVMYWALEGAGDMAEFARQYVVTGDAVLFDDACLADVDALTGGP